MTTHARRRRESEPGGGPQIRVLIADDDDAFRSYLSLLTRRLGATVETAHDGEEALARLRSESFDLLLCDYEMPKQNGLEVITRIRSDASISGLYAVMLTAHDELALKVHALSLGFDDFLSKGCTEIEVVAKVAAARRMLSRQRALDSAVQEWQGIASRDELTGVASRRFFFEEAAASLSEGEELGVVLFDLNDFKRVNDTHGHLVGDRMLRDIGGLFLRGTRQEDIIARYGGDEFVLLVRGLSIEETHAVAERLTHDIAALQWAAGTATLTAAVSYGLGFSTLVTDPNVEKVLDAADRDLYARKWLGRNPNSIAPSLYEYGAPGDTALVIRMPRASEEGESTIVPGSDLEQAIDRKSESE